MSILFNLEISFPVPKAEFLNINSAQLCITCRLSSCISCQRIIYLFIARFETFEVDWSASHHFSRHRVVFFPIRFPQRGDGCLRARLFSSFNLLICYFFNFNFFNFIFENLLNYIWESMKLYLRIYEIIFENLSNYIWESVKLYLRICQMIFENLSNDIWESIKWYLRIYQRIFENRSNYI